MMLPLLEDSGKITRYEQNPVLSAKDIPYKAGQIFNAGVARLKDEYIMIFRNDYGYEYGKGYEGISVGFARSRDGISWTADPKPFIVSVCENGVWHVLPENISNFYDIPGSDDFERMYDPRLTIIDGIIYICFAMDTRHGLRGGIGKLADDLSSLEIISLSVPDNRNMVLFSEKINGRYVRLERPFPVYSRGKDRFDIWLSYSPDLVYWGESHLVIGVESVPFANDKLGPAAPPLKTEKGWLTLFHAVDIDSSRGKNGYDDIWQKRYSMGIMLLDLNNPQKIIGYSKKPVLAPTADYEINSGYRQDVIFPGGLLNNGDGTVNIYYGAADTFECLATAKIDDLIALCTETL